MRMARPIGGSAFSQEDSSDFGTPRPRIGPVDEGENRDPLQAS